MTKLLLDKRPTTEERRKKEGTPGCQEGGGTVALSPTMEIVSLGLLGKKDDTGNCLGRRRPKKKGVIRCQATIPLAKKKARWERGANNVHSKGGKGRGRLLSGGWSSRACKKGKKKVFHRKTLCADKVKNCESTRTQISGINAGEAYYPEHLLIFRRKKKPKGHPEKTGYVTHKMKSQREKGFDLLTSVGRWGRTYPPPNGGGGLRNNLARVRVGKDTGEGGEGKKKKKKQRRHARPGFGYFGLILRGIRGKKQR